MSYPAQSMTVTALCFRVKSHQLSLFDTDGARGNILRLNYTKIWLVQNCIPHVEGIESFGADPPEFGVDFLMTTFKRFILNNLAYSPGIPMVLYHWNLPFISSTEGSRSIEKNIKVYKK